MNTPFHVWGWWVCSSAFIFTVPTTCLAQETAAPVAMREIVFNFTAADGVPLEAKLTVPGDAAGPVPVVFYLHGAGPRSYDNPFRYVDEAGQRQTIYYLDFHARELAQRGIAFCRMSKRGCHAQPERRSMRLDRAVFSQALPSVLLTDYETGLKTLRARSEIDPARIVLLASSEGTQLAPQLAQRAPAGIQAIVMSGYAGDNQKDTVVWQNSVGAWRSLVATIPDAADGVLTKAEYDALLATAPATASATPFVTLDGNADGAVTPDELAALVKPRLDAVLKAVEERNDDLIWQAVVQLTSAYLLETWEAGPNHARLLPLEIPLAIFHGDLDASTRVEAVHETAEVFRAAGKTNLTVRTYPRGTHDLDWSREAALAGCPPAYRELFDCVAAHAHGQATGL